MLKYVLSILFTLTPLVSIYGQCSGGSCGVPTVPYAAPYAAPSAPQAEEMEPIVPADVKEKVEKASVQVITVISQTVGRTEYAKGSGTIIRLGDRLAIITAGHVVAKGTPAYIKTYDGIVAKYEIRYVDTTTDFAILEPVEQQETLYMRGVELFSGYPDQEGSYILSGYDGGSYVRIWRARLFGRLLTTGTQKYHWIQFNRPARQGDSGGGIFSKDGRLFGIIWGTDNERTVATIVDPVTLYLNENYQTCLFWRFRQRVKPPDVPIPGPVPDPGQIPIPGPTKPDTPPITHPKDKPPVTVPSVPAPAPEPSIWTEVLNGIVIGLVAYCAFMLVFLGIETYNILRKV